MLNELLEGLLDRIPGSLAAVLAGLDGLVVDSRTRDPECPFEPLAAHGARLFRNGEKAIGDLSEPVLQELMLVSGRNFILLRSVGSSYFLLLILARTACLGKARYELQKAEKNFAAELA